MDGGAEQVSAAVPAMTRRRLRAAFAFAAFPGRERPPGYHRRMAPPLFPDASGAVSLPGLAGRGDAIEHALAGCGVRSVLHAAVQVVREQDQAQGHRHQEGEDHREMLEEHQVVVAHAAPVTVRIREV